MTYRQAIDGPAVSGTDTAGCPHRGRPGRHGPRPLLPAGVADQPIEVPA
ncbi:hypothetical protein ACGFZP_26930 [Kitasatospora sp. NPDC048239]